MRSGSKAEIMVDHFHEQVLALNKIGGQARAMVPERARLRFGRRCAPQNRKVVTG
jgi:hypothetical protein